MAAGYGVDRERRGLTSVDLDADPQLIDDEGVFDVQRVVVVTRAPGMIVNWSG